MKKLFSLSQQELTIKCLVLACDFKPILSPLLGNARESPGRSLGNVCHLCVEYDVV